MKAITIKQPWASLIVHGIKDIENRVGEQISVDVSLFMLPVPMVESLALT